MAITLGGTNSATGSGSATVTLTRPAATVGDVVIVAISEYSGATIAPTNPTTGWTVIQNTSFSGGSYAHTQWVGWRLYDAADPADYVFSCQGTLAVGAIVTYSRINALTPIGASAVSSAGSNGSATLVTPSVTPNEVGDLLVSVGGQMDNNGFTNVLTPQSPLATVISASGNQGYVAVAIASEVVSALGPSATRTILSSQSGTWGTTTFVIRPGGFDPSTAPVAFGASGSLQGGTSVYFLDAVVPVTFQASTFLGNTYFQGSAAVVFGTASAWQPGVKFESSTDPSISAHVKFLARGILDVTAPPTPPPSDLVYMKRVTVTMPPPSLDSRGNPN